MRLVRQTAESLRAFARIFANRRLRAVQLAGLGSVFGTWIYAIAVSVYAYEAGGARAVGVLCFVRWGLAGAFGPWLGVYVDRLSRKRVMVGCDLIRLGLIGGIAAVVASGGPSLAVYALAVVASIVSSAFEPAQAALLPSLVDEPDELTAANVVMSTMASVSMFAGPALGGLLLAVSGPSAVFATTAGTFAWSALWLSRLPADPPPDHAEDESPLASMLGGFRAILDNPGLRLVVGLSSMQTLVAGAMGVLTVVVALRTLAAGEGGVGWLNAAFGIGALLGLPAVASLAGRKRLAGDLGIGIVLWGLPLALVPLWPSLGFVFALFVVTGIGNTLVDVSGITLLQRTAPDEVLGRVFAILESLVYATLALGSLATPALISAVGVKATLVAVGLVLPVLLVPCWRGLRRVDAAAHVATEQVEVLGRLPLFAGLPAPVLERLASAAVDVTASPMTAVVGQGEVGDRFYVIASGHATVDVDGAERSELGPGDFFGEIALLRDVPRTATVRALDTLRLFALERDDFIAAVTGHAPGLEAAERVIATRLPAGAAI